MFVAILSLGTWLPPFTTKSVAPKYVTKLVCPRNILSSRLPKMHVCRTWTNIKSLKYLIAPVRRLPNPTLLVGELLSRDFSNSAQLWFRVCHPAQPRPHQNTTRAKAGCDNSLRLFLNKSIRDSLNITIPLGLSTNFLCCSAYPATWNSWDPPSTPRESYPSSIPIYTSSQCNVRS